MDYLKSKKKESKTQADAGLIENQVSPKVVKIENITRLAVNGQVWEKQEFTLVA